MAITKRSKKMAAPSMKQSKLGFAPTKAGPATGKPRKKLAFRTASVSSGGGVDFDTTDEEPEQQAVFARDGPASRDAPPPVVEVKKEALDLQDKSGRWKTHYGKVRGLMGNIPPVHRANQTKVHDILRVFDNSHEYGPCVGVSRLERWERAAGMGLDPPSEVREILLTKEGSEETQFSQSVFYDEV